MEALFILIVVVCIALAFDFTNGFHDTGNAMATSIATGALRPRVAVALSAVLNLIGAFLSIQVALTVSNKIINIQGDTGAPIPSLMGVPILTIVFAGLVGGILWNLATWLFGLPSSSSHALFGGLIGSAIAALGWGGVKWSGVITSIALPAVFAPVVAAVVSAIGTRLVYAITARVGPQTRDRGFRWGQIGSASLVSLAHGTGDAQKTMGVITLALIAYGSWTSTDSIPVWVKIACALSIALGTYVGGWRVIRTLGKGLVEIESPQGMAAETASAAAILTSSHLGMALSTTHVATGSILGSGLGRKGASVRWGIAGRMVVAWLITLPAAGLVGGVCWAIANALGPNVGTGVVLLVLIGASGYIFHRSRRNLVDAGNVNAEWQGGLVPVADQQPTPAAGQPAGV
ncbi:inorganic phosphate transporter [Microlunatus sp. Gsoil 973]|uniref:inorganic phosphate transporter n=1 Tax=Microlunatus sp. Gsoil 973 TaxID=2672569 RepID=UPI0012B4994D|nr:inorganic phosphate transporter [Microlunatus sp. Gsoil 973]QGN32342.1 inorganic phosphate transporter [Microlunatus sp. Gsoil 973]